MFSFGSKKPKGCDDLGPNIGPIKDLVTRSMLRKIQEGMDLQRPNGLHGFQMLFSWAKEDIKI